MIFNEVYVGRKPELEHMCELMGESRALYMNNKVGAARKKLSEIEPLVEDFFGFGSFSLDIDPDTDINAFTQPTVFSLMTDVNKALYTTNNGYKLKKEAKLAAISKITSGLFGNENFTDEEVFAIFLHEVGHSFVTRSPLMDAQIKTVRAQQTANLFFSLVIRMIIPPLAAATAFEIFERTNLAKRINAEMNKAAKKIPILNGINYRIDKGVTSLFSGISHFWDFIYTVTGINTVIGTVSNLIGKAIKTNKNNDARVFDRSNERLADDFVTTYGYGEQLSTALMKMQNRAYIKSSYVKFCDSVPIINKIYEFNRRLAYEYVWAIGAHPSSPDRILSIIENMEHDIKTSKDLSDKDKKALTEQLKATKKIADDTVKDLGEISKNKEVYLKSLNILGFKNGSSENNKERAYTDMDKLDSRFDDLHEDAFITQEDLETRTTIDEAFSEFLIDESGFIKNMKNRIGCIKMMNEYNKEHNIQMDGIVTYLKLKGKNPGYDNMLKKVADDDISTWKWLATDNKNTLTSVTLLAANVKLCEEKGKCDETKKMYNAIEKNIFDNDITYADCKAAVAHTKANGEFIAKKLKNAQEIKAQKKTKPVKESVEFNNDIFGW